MNVKKIIFLIIFLILILLVIVPVVFSVEKIEENLMFEKEKETEVQIQNENIEIRKNYEDFEYTIDNGEVTITKYTGNSENVIIPEKIDGNNVTTIEKRAFYYNLNIENVEMPNTIKRIEGAYDYGAFGDCKKLKNIKLSENLEYIGAYAFQYCNSLERIDIPSSVKKIAAGAFYNCENLIIVNFSEGLKEIEGFAFRGCKLFEVVLPDSVETMGCAFSDCDYLERVKVSKNLINASGAFYSCDKLKYVEIPEGAKVTGGYSNCISLKSIELPNSITEIEEGAFWFCSNLENIKLSNNLISIGKNAFFGCEKINEKLIFPSTLQTIGDNAFRECNNLKTITIPKSVSRIGENTFYNIKTNLTIKGYENSYAKLYANQYNIKFVLIDEKIKCTVSFDLNGVTGNSPIDKEVYYGNLVNCPEEPNVGGYRFIAWYKDQKCESLFEFEKEIITKDITLYAKWEKLPFDDIDSNKWYIDGVTYVYKNNIMTGYNSTTFGTNSSITRGQIATMLYRLAGSPDTTGLANPFSDVPAGKYYTEPVKWAYSKGITTGKTSTKFDPDGNVTRQELAVFMARYAKEIKGLDTTSTYNITGIADYADLSTWAKAPMQYIMEKGVITGDMKLGYPRILPRNNATRAEAATMFMRFCLNIS